MDITALKSKILETEKQLNDLVIQANKEIAFLQGKVQALRDLLDELEKESREA